MAKEKDPKDGGPGHQGNDDPNNKGKDPGSSDDPTKNKEPDDGKGGGAGGDDPPFITAERLTSVLDARSRIQQKEFKEFRSGLDDSVKKQFDDVLEKLNEIGSKKPEPADDVKKESQEVIELKRELDQIKAKADASEKRANSEAAERRNDKFEATVKDELVKAGCHDPVMGLRSIKPELNVSEDGTKIFATVKTDYGEEDLPLPDYIKREFAERVCPWLFKGKMRTGVTAEGESGVTGSGYTLTREQAFNAEEYAKDPDKHRAALEGDQVKGVRRGAGHVTGK